MSLETFIVTNFYNAVEMFGAGIMLSCSDRLFSENAKRFTKQRLEKKAKQVSSLSYLAEKEDSLDRSDILSSKEYFDNIMNTREYFEDRRISVRNYAQAGSKGIVEKVKGVIKKFSYSRAHERLNNLNASAQIAFSYGINLAFDAIVVVSRATTGVGHPLAAIGHTTYQGLALFCGLQTGKGILWIKDYIRKSKDEKDLDQIAKELTADGKLLEIVRNYSPTANTKGVESKVIEETEQTQLPEGKTADYSPLEKASDLGERVGTKIADTAEGVGRNIHEGIDAIRKRMQERKAAKDAEEKRVREKLRSQYDKY